jgi:hypothetical protein
MMFSARSMPMAVNAIGYVMLPLSNNFTATEERCFLLGPCKDVISKTVRRDLVWDVISCILTSLWTFRMEVLFSS